MTNNTSGLIAPETAIPGTTFHEPKPYGTGTETFLAAIYMILMTSGIPTNIISTYYFSVQTVRRASTKEYFKWIYTNMAAVDLISCTFCFPVISVFLSKNRDSVFFSNDLFCKVWGFLWEIVPYYSVFLVLVLSMSRMMILVYPMMVLSKRLLIFSLSGYVILLVIAKVAFYMGRITAIDFTKRDALCILIFVEENQNLYPIYTFFNIILLSLPIIPICISCVLSIYRMYRTEKAVNGARKASSNLMVKRKNSIKKSTVSHKAATITVILVTVTYILCNLPVFFNYVLYGYWSALTWSGKGSTYRQLYNTVFMYYYSWNTCLVLLVVLNASLNPIIYMTRMKEYREFIVEKCRGTIVVIREHSQIDQTEFSIS